MAIQDEAKRCKCGHRIDQHCGNLYGFPCYQTDGYNRCSCEDFREENEDCCDSCGNEDQYCSCLSPY